MASFKDRLSAAKDSIATTYRQSIGEETLETAREKRDAREFQLVSTQGFLRLYPDYLEWKLGMVGVADNVQRVLYSEITSVSMGSAIKPVGGVTGAVLSGGLSLAASKQKSITLNARGATHTFDFRVEPTARVREAVDMITQRSFEAKSKPAEVIVTNAHAPSSADELAKLAALHRDGVLTDDEFASAKAKLLNAT